jgi:hypothetical protein
MKERQAGSTGEAEGMRTRLAEMDKQLAQGTKRLLAAPDDIADLLGAELSKLRKDRDRLAERLAEIQPAGRYDLGAQADALADRLWSLTEELADAPAPPLAGIAWVDRIPGGPFLPQGTVGPEDRFPLGIRGNRPSARFGFVQAC